MAKTKSSIAKLDPRIHEAVDAAVREGRATIDEVVLLIRSMGGEASRSAVGRYVKNATEQMAKYARFQEVAKVWIGKMHEEPDGDIGRLAAEILRMVALQVGQQMGEQSAEDVSPMDVMLLSKALDHLSRSGKVDLDAFKARREMKLTFEKLENAAKKSGGKLSLEDLQRIREQAYGIAP